MSADGDVIVAPSAVDRHSENFIYRWEVSRQSMTPIAWDPVLRADSDVIGINDVCVDREQTVHLVTTVGLLSLPLDAKIPVWRRTFPDKRIDALLSTTAAGSRAESAVFMAYHERHSTPSPEKGGKDWYPYYQLVLYYPRTGDIEAMPVRHGGLRGPGCDHLTGLDDDVTDTVESMW